MTTGPAGQNLHRPQQERSQQSKGRKGAVGHGCPSMTGHEAALATGRVQRSRRKPECAYRQGKVLSRATEGAGVEGPGTQSPEDGATDTYIQVKPRGLKSGGTETWRSGEGQRQRPRERAGRVP